MPDEMILTIACERCGTDFSVPVKPQPRALLQTGDEDGTTVEIRLQSLNSAELLDHADRCRGKATGNYGPGNG